MQQQVVQQVDKIEISQQIRNTRCFTSCCPTNKYFAEI